MQRFAVVTSLGLCVLVVHLCTSSCFGENNRFVVKAESKRITRLVINAKDGSVSTTELLNALGTMEGYDPGALTDLLPSGSFPIDTRWTRWSVWSWNKVLPDGVRVEVMSGTKKREPCLVILVDREKLQTQQRILQRQIRGLVTWAGFGKKLDRTLRDAKLLQKLKRSATRKELVVVLHGYQDQRNSADLLTEFLTDKGFIAVALEYPNDQPITDSAIGISKSLKTLCTQLAVVEVRIVAHSMGGLGARRMIEDPELDPGNVSQLIMVATPNHGSELAALGGSLELWEHVWMSKETVSVQTLCDIVADGSNEAGADLEPESIFLRKLNARKRNPKVRYSTILGSTGFLEKGDIKALKRLIAVAKQNRVVRFFGPKLDRILDNPDSMIKGKGDGAVSLISGRLPGVEDHLVLPIDHCAVFRKPKTNDEKRLRTEIVSRLRRPTKN